MVIDWLELLALIALCGGLSGIVSGCVVVLLWREEVARAVLAHLTREQEAAHHMLSLRDRYHGQGGAE